MPWCIARLCERGGREKERGIALMSNERAVSPEGRSTRRYCYRETRLFLIIEKEPEVAACDVVLFLLLLLLLDTRLDNVPLASMETKGEDEGVDEVTRRGPPFDRGKTKQRGRRGRWPTCSFFRLPLMNRGTRIPSPLSFSLIASTWLGWSVLSACYSKHPSIEALRLAFIDIRSRWTTTNSLIHCDSINFREWSFMI